MRKVLIERRWPSRLFDRRQWVGDIEIAYEQMWRKWVNVNWMGEMFGYYRS